MLRFTALFATGLICSAPLPAGTTTNLVSNPYFDDNIVGWQPFGSTPVWSSDDAQGLSFSGSIQFSVGGDILLIVAQCVALDGLSEYQFEVDIRQSAGTGNPFRTMAVEWFSDASCTNQIDSSNVLQFDVASDWQRYTERFITELGSQSARVSIGAGTSSGGATIQFDNVYFGATRLLVDRFEQRAPDD